LRRRQFLGLVAGSTLGSAFGIGRADEAQSGGGAFRHGVASGDPLADSIILWTRVSGQAAPVRVGWQLARDPALRSIVKEGEVVTGPERDYTVKVDANGLEPDAVYYYRFTSDGQSSPVGRTRTLPAGTVDSVRFAVVSCSNYPYGYFHVYRDIAEQDDIDAVLHLGDYLYEYPMGGYATEFAAALGREPEPRHETVTLDDYRRRHAQYKSDPDSQAMHSRHPLIAIWDDHEIANDAYRSGAQNHQAEEADYAERVRAAVQAYFEWMPIRGTAAGIETRIYRGFDYGDLVSLVMLDTRLVGRDAQPDANGETDPQVIGRRMQDPSRRLLGREQEAWLIAELDRSLATWQLIGQQVMVAPTRSANLEPLLDLESNAGLPREMLEQYIAVSRSNPPMLLDTWNGYPAAREDFLKTLAEHARNPVVVTGDLHTAMAADLARAGSDVPIAVELMTTSVTSPGFDEYLPQVRPNAVRDATLEINPMLRYMETSRRGWLAVKFDRAACTAEWRLVDTVHAPSYTVSVDKRLEVLAGQIGKGLIEA
jgi:alkaline phosphatase D